MTNVFIIALDADESRVSKARQVFVGYDIEIHKAFDGRGRKPHQCSNPSISPLSRGPLTGGEYGCARSHNEVWGKISQGDLDCAIVLEEDWMAASTFDHANLRDLVSALSQNENPALVYMGWRDEEVSPFNIFKRIYWQALSVVKCALPHPEPWVKALNYNVQNRGRSSYIQKTQKGDVKLFTSGLPHGTHGYVLNKKAAIALLNLNFQCCYRSDEALNLAEMMGLVRMIRPEFPLVDWNKNRISTISHS